MTFQELFREEEFETVFQEVEKFSENQLTHYIDKLQKQTLIDQTKEIFDAVWGNVVFSSGEIYILDSPLLQRLRRIKQLGLAYFVYCGSDYSRFYHTIGVTFLADRMASAVNRCKTGASEERKAYFRAVVRLAAIFHDAGHMFLSHVSEHYFSKSPLYPRNKLIDKMLVTFEKKASKSIALHEILSCMIVNTKEVRRLLEMVSGHIDGLDGNKLKNDTRKMDKLIEHISCLIVGVPVDRESLPYSNMINGPIDADKCDYLSRDSHVTRVPAAVDISRITQKLSVVEVKDINTSELWHEDAGPQKELYELAMKESGEKSLFQLCIARTIMFDSVYYHHKVLTAESEYRNIINELSNLEKPVFLTFTEILNYTDEDFNRYFFDSLKKVREESDIGRIDRVGRQIDKLYERELAKRIACFLPEYLIGSQSNKEELFDSILTRLDAYEEKSFIEELKREYIHIGNLLGKQMKSAGDMNIFVIQAPTNIFGHSKIQVPIDLQNGYKRDFRGYELVSSRETSSSASYIVTDEDDRMLVYLALEKILYRKFSVTMKNECITCGKFNSDVVNSLCVKLFKKGYYDDSPQLLRDDFVGNYLSEPKVNRIVEKYSAYEGPKGYKISETAVKDFFRQILSSCRNKSRCKAIVDGIYCLLENAVFINREFLYAHIIKKLEEIEICQDVLYVIPLGSLRDSAKHMTYFWNDAKWEKFGIETELPLKDVLSLPEVESIMFFDDGSFSGVQLISIMQEYMGVPMEKRRSPEHHVEALPEELCSVFRNKKIIFFFIAFNRTKEEEMKKQLSGMGLKDVQFLYVEDMSMKYLEKGERHIVKDEDQRKALKEFLCDIGFEIMDSGKKLNGVYKDGWDAERVKRASLGYNDAQQMVFLKSSVPTYTITAFWQEGSVKGRPWKPLFRRTEK